MLIKVWGETAQSFITIFHWPPNFLKQKENLFLQLWSARDSQNTVHTQVAGLWKHTASDKVTQSVREAWSLPLAPLSQITSFSSGTECARYHQLELPPARSAPNQTLDSSLISAAQQVHFCQRNKFVLFMAERECGWKHEVKHPVSGVTL